MHLTDDLSCWVTTTPDPLQVSEADGIKTGDIALHLKPKDSVVRRRITVSFPCGDTDHDLTEAAHTGKDAFGRTVASKSWSASAPKLSADGKTCSFTVDAKRGEATITSTEPLTILLKGVQINQRIGDTHIVVDCDGATASFPLVKVPANFEFYGLHAEPLALDKAGQSTTLTWKLSQPVARLKVRWSGADDKGVVRQDEKDLGSNSRVQAYTVPEGMLFNTTVFEVIAEVADHDGNIKARPTLCIVVLVNRGTYLTGDLTVQGTSRIFGGTKILIGAPDNLRKLLGDNNGRITYTTTTDCMVSASMQGTSATPATLTFTIQDRPPQAGPLPHSTTSGTEPFFGLLADRKIPLTADNARGASITFFAAAGSNFHLTAPPTAAVGQIDIRWTALGVGTVSHQPAPRAPAGTAPQLPTGNICAAFYTPTDPDANAADELRGRAYLLTRDKRLHVRDLRPDGSWSTPSGPDAVLISKRWTGYGTALCRQPPATAVILKARLPYFIQAVDGQCTLLAPGKGAEAEEQSKNAWFKVGPGKPRPLAAIFTDLPQEAQLLTSATALINQDKAVVFRDARYWLVHTDASTDSLPLVQNLTFTPRATMAIGDLSLLVLGDDGTWHAVTIAVDKDESSGAVDWSTFKLHAA